jgi:hypothetical protein
MINLDKRLIDKYKNKNTLGRVSFIGKTHTRTAVIYRTEISLPSVTELVESRALRINVCLHLRSSKYKNENCELRSA